MRTALVTLAAFLPLLAAAAPPAWAPPYQGRDFAEVEIRAVHVAGKVHVLYGAGGNLGASVGDDGTFLIDDQFAPLAPKIRAALEELGGGAPGWLLNTHWHGDHTGGNGAFGPDATLLAHRNVRRRLAGDAELGGRVAEEAPAPGALPDVTYDEGVSLFLNGEEVVVRHVGPAHTDGDSVVWFTESKVAHLGDLFFEAGYPFVDLDSGGDVAGYLAALDEVLEWLPADAKVIPGHGELTDVEGFRAFRDMYATVLERVREALAEGRSAEQMLEVGLLDDLQERWGNFGFMPAERFLPIVVRGLQG